MVEWNMSNTAISVRGLGKKYRLGATLSPDTLRDHVMKTVARLKGRNKSEKAPSRDFWALKDVSFDVQQGEVLGVIGPNGAGKSTLLKILTGITEPTEGEVRIKGRVASLLEVGTGFHLELSGRENIFMNGAILGMTQKEIKVKFDEIVDFAGIEKFLDTPVKRYSSGMRVRLGFAVAAHLSAEILMIDEVLAVGDAEFQSKCLGKMNEISKVGRTLIFVSHNLAAIQHLCTRGVLLRKGKVIIDSTSTTAIEKYFASNIHLSENGYFIDNTQTNKQTDKPIRILKGCVSSPNQLNSGIFPINDPLTFEIECECYREISNAIIGIRIDSFKGVRILTLHSECSQIPFEGDIPKGRILLRCQMDSNIPLVPGQYICRLEIATPIKTLDLVENKLRFVVESNDFFGNGGKRLNSGDIVLCKQKWLLEN